MKKQTGIWIDTKKAIIVTIDGQNESITEILSDIENPVHHNGEGNKGAFFGDQHVNSEKTFDERKKHQTNNYLKNVISKVAEADELYVFGPAETKNKLQQKINSEKTEIATKLKLVETADSMTQNQVVAQVKKFFKK
ncbi:hypothetical protein [Flavobacterium faecale]|uniref:hypothetical protein n=1 Tax=Flavobacterium faecale TaxID=1355330 RepID=UPI003AB0B88D